LSATARQVIERARDGDLAAAKLLFSYVIGRPAESVDPDTLDVKEIQLFRQAQVESMGTPGILQGMPVDLACEIVRQVLPYTSHDLARRLAETLEEGVEQKKSPD